MKIRRPQKPKIRNFVAKHAKDMSGAGEHEPKNGKFAKRCKQKRAWKKHIQHEQE